MYNEDQKLQYISEQKSENTGKQLKGLFGRSESCEEELGLDICEMDRGQLAYLLGLVAGTKNASIMSSKSLLAQYMDWCSLNGYSGSSGKLIRGIKNEEVDVSGRFRQQYVGSKNDLMHMLDTVYPISDNASRYKRLLILLCFAGMEAEEIQKLKKTDVDLQGGMIHSPVYEAVSYQANDEILALCEYCIEETSREWPDGRKRRVADNLYVIRPLAGRKNISENDPINYQMTAEIARDFSREYNKKTGSHTSITTDRIRESGEFIRFFDCVDKEKYLGESMDTEIAMRRGVSSRHNMLLKKNEFRKAYLEWARAFGYGTADLPEVTTDYMDEVSAEVQQPKDIFDRMLDTFVGKRGTEVRNSEQYERDKRLISQMKAAYGYRCQLCDQYFDIDMGDGRKYVEVHHIVPNSKGYDEEGQSLDHPGNLIVVCPNHHRYLHYNQGGCYRLKKDGENMVLSNGKDMLPVIHDLHLYRFWKN